MAKKTKEGKDGGYEKSRTKTTDHAIGWHCKYRPGDCAAQGFVRFGLPIPGEPERPSRKTRHRLSSETQSDFHARMLLAWPFLRERKASKIAPRILASEARSQSQAGCRKAEGTSKNGVASVDRLAMRASQAGEVAQAHRRISGKTVKNTFAIGTKQVNRIDARI
jgi:hypothetical protein